MTTGSTSRQPVWRLSVRFLIELVVVFSGVYLAFLLNGYRENKVRNTRREQICSALVREIETISQAAEQTARGGFKIVRDFNSTLENGDFPKLIPIVNPAQFTPFMWNATIQSDGLNLLKVETIEQIAAFYNATQETIDHLAQIRHLSEMYIIPNQDKGTEEFYDVMSKSLKSKYSWYLTGLERIAQRCEAIHTIADTLIIQINQL